MQTKRHFLHATLIAASTLLLAPCALAKSSLWKAASDKGTLYIQGSVHLLKADDYPLAPAIEKAYADSQALVLEVDMESMLAPKTQQMLMSKAMLAGNKTLKDTLSPEVYGELAALLDGSGLPPAAMQQFKPWFVSLTVVMAKLQAMGFDPNLGLDHYFHGKATAEGKEVIGLETAEFQIDLFDSLAKGNQDDYIMHMVQEMEMVETQLGAIMAAWETGNAEELGNLMLASFSKYPNLHKRFVVERNKAWAKKLAKLVDREKTHMVVVGAAHLPGKSGLLNLLEKQGFKLEQL
jgi:hypothetical protein